MTTTELRQLTRGDHHFFGYYDKSPWDATEGTLLCHRVDFRDRIPTAEDAAEICLVDPETGESDAVGTTTAWSFQLGASLAWLGPDYTRRFLYNDRAENGSGFVARVHDRESGEVRTLPSTVYAVTPDGRTGFTLDFDRLYHTRQGYGYEPAAEARRAAVPDAPDDEGVYRVDLETGERELLVSLAALRGYSPVPSMEDGPHWVNHIQLDPTGSKVAFLHRWRVADAWRTRLFALDRDGSNLTLLESGYVSHYDWRAPDELMAWTRHGGRRAFHVYDPDDRAVRVVAPETLTHDGHNSFSPDGNWVLTDSYPRGDDRRHLLLYDYLGGQLHELDAVPGVPVENNDLRCDLHPRWDRTGRRVCADSLHTGKRQLHLADLRPHTLPDL